MICEEHQNEDWAQCDFAEIVLIMCDLSAKE